MSSVLRVETIEITDSNNKTVIILDKSGIHFQTPNGEVRLVLSAKEDIATIAFHRTGETRLILLNADGGHRCDLAQ